MHCSKSIAERLAVLLAAALLGGCGVIAQQAPGTLIVRDARVDVNAESATLELGLDCRLSGPMQDALDHGIPITLRIDLRAGSWPRASDAAKRIELRYFPLSRRYQLHDLDQSEVRSYATPGYLVAALGSLHLNLPKAFAALPPATPLQVSARIDPAALPGALRLPALFEPAWKLASADFKWTPAAR
ncbi:MAG: DUF4390 domain-containing protein [Dokdonella sp.]